jgi:hypothetical protein
MARAGPRVIWPRVIWPRGIGPRGIGPRGSGRSGIRLWGAHYLHFFGERVSLAGGAAPPVASRAGPTLKPCGQFPQGWWCLWCFFFLWWLG